MVCDCYRLRPVIHGPFVTGLFFPALINASIHCDSSQPVREVLSRFQRGQVLVKLQENFLGHVFRQGAVLKVMPADAENHGLAIAHNLSKGAGIALAGALKRRPEMLLLVSLQKAVLLCLSNTQETWKWVQVCLTWANSV